MWWAVVAIFACAPLGPAVLRFLGERAHWMLAIVPLIAFGWLGSAIPALPTGPPTREVLEWAPSLGVRLALRLDGLSLVLALLITGIGALIVVYASAYGVARERRARFQATLFVFMGSMLGLVLADDVILLFVFWELTSVTSYLLIATKHEDPSAVRNARQALLITSSGGLALLAGLLLLADAANTRNLSGILTQGERLVSDPSYPAILALIAAGAFTKSAIFPFHLWLPNAMSAPTPVSAYLHSATMVKAGIYLLARMRPALGGTDAWMLLLGLAGAATIGIASTRVLRQNDLKAILAETTVIALGALVMMLGMPTPHASTAVVVFLVVHALYKASLFMIAGIVDKQTGTRDVRDLGGLARAMPRTAAIATLSGVAMMGLPPMFGFIGKELIYETTLGTDRFAPLWTTAAFVGNALTVTGALLVVHHTFFGRARLSSPRAITDAGTMILLPPALIAVASLAFGVFHSWAGMQLVRQAVRAIEGARTPVELSLWHGFRWSLALSTVTVITGVMLYARRAHVLDFGSRFPRIFEARADRVYDAVLEGLVRIAGLVTRRVQTGMLRHYVLVTALCAASFTALALEPFQVALPEAVDPFAVAVIVLTGAAALLAVGARGRIVPLIAVMVVGYGIALVFVLHGAPDVAFTQLTVETLLVVLVTLALGRFRAPSVPRRSRAVWARDAAVGLALGGAVAAVLLAVLQVPLDDSLSAYFVAQSVPGAHGRNVVNTILVDFRALDTLGEITVLGAAALGAATLLRPEDRA